MKQWVSRLRPHAPGLIFGGFFCVMLALHAAMPVGLGDDPMYRDMLNRMSLWQFLPEHYATWSARSLVEAVLCTVAALPPAVARGRCTAGGAVCLFGRAHGRVRAQPMRRRNGRAVLFVL